MNAESEFRSRRARPPVAGVRPGLDKMAMSAECLQISVRVPSAAVPQWNDVVDFEWSTTAAMPAAVFIATKS